MDSGGGDGDGSLTGPEVAHTSAFADPDTQNPVFYGGCLVAGAQNPVFNVGCREFADPGTQAPVFCGGCLIAGAPNPALYRNFAGPRTENLVC